MRPQPLPSRWLCSWWEKAVIITHTTRAMEKVSHLRGFEMRLGWIEERRRNVRYSKSKASKAEKWQVFLSRGVWMVTRWCPLCEQPLYLSCISTLTPLGNPNTSFTELRQCNEWLIKKHSDLSFGPDLTNQLTGWPRANISLSSFFTSEKFRAHSLKLLQALKLYHSFSLLRNQLSTCMSNHQLYTSI